MSTSSKIEWTETTWNPIAGCTPVSAGCRNCYAANHARRLAGNPNPKVSRVYEGTARTAGDGRAVFTGRVNLMPERLEQPLRWKKPRRVFVNSMSDLFHEDVPEDFIDQVFAIMALAPQHTFQILTKRPGRMAEYVNGVWCIPERYTLWAARGHRMIVGLGRTELTDRQAPPQWPLSNVWLGTSVEDQAAADERIPHLLRTPAAVRFLSCEPLLGPVDLRPYVTRLNGVLACPKCGYRTNTFSRCPNDGQELVRDFGVDWVIIGGESGPGARPCDVAWIRSLVERCQEAGVPAFTKQLGSVLARELGSDDRKGGAMEDWPEDIRVRRFPEAEVVRV